MKRALITGCTGYIGRHLTTYLFTRGWQVHGISRSRDNISQSTESSIIYLYDGSLSSLQKIVKLVNPDCIFHLATKYIADHDGCDIEDLIDGNIRFGLYLLESMRSLEGVVLVNASTSWQSFSSSHDYPVNLYAATKDAFERLVDYYCSSTSLKCVSLRLYDTYGRNDKRNKIYNYMTAAIAASTTIKLSPGFQKLFLVHIDDVCRAFEHAYFLAAESKSMHYRYAVRGTKAITLRQLAQHLETKMGKPLLAEWGALTYRKREVMDPVSNIEVLPNWSATTTEQEFTLVPNIRPISLIE